MKRKVAVIIGSLLIFTSLFIHNVTGLTSKESENLAVTIHIKQYNSQQSVHVKDSLLKISLEKAKQIKEKILSMERNYSGAEKIKEQLKIMHEMGVISSDFTFDALVTTMEKIDRSYSPSSLNVKPFLILDGPLIISHFTLGGRIRGFSLKPWYYEHFTSKNNSLLDRSYFSGVVGALPFYVGISFKPVFITAISVNDLRSYNNLFLPFIEVMVPCIGTSVAFVFDAGHSSPVILFEYNLDLCLIGALGGITI